MSTNIEMDYDISALKTASDKMESDSIAEMVFLGIDIGGTNTKIGTVTGNGRIVEMTSFPTNAHKSFNAFIVKLMAKVESDLINEKTGVKIAGIGIGAPNANHWTGKIESPSNLSWGTVDIGSQLNEVYHVPVAITNDANAAAIGEKYFGAARGMNDFIVLTLGTGLGSGIMVNNTIIYGAGGHAGEIGHILAQPNGRLCGCGRCGCLETYASVTGIRRTVSELLGELSEKSILRSIGFDELRGEDITNAAEQGDKIAIQAFERTGKILGLNLADVVALLNPEAIILAGGLAQAGDYILEPVKRHLENNLLSIYKGYTKVLQSGVKEGNLAVLGASAMIMQEVNGNITSITSKDSKIKKNLASLSQIENRLSDTRDKQSL